MKIFQPVIVTIIGIALFSACQKEISPENINTAAGSLAKTLSGDCSPVSLGGVFIKNQLLDAGNFINVQVNFTEPGSYVIKSDTVNGYSFKGEGEITNAGTFTVKLQASGTPVAAGLDLFTIHFNTSVCQASVSVGTASAVYTMGGSPGSCTGATIAGTYTNGVALTASNTVTVQANVTTIGAYSISTVSINGILFSSSGIFSSTGVQSVVLTGSGVPTIPGSYTCTIAGSGGCAFVVPVLNATGSLATLTTTAASGISCTYAVSGGNITNDGGSAITARGLCVSTSPSPTIASGATSNGTGTGVFTSNISGLTNNTTYYVRAYATNSAGTAYGNEISFTTTAGTCAVTIHVAGYEDIYNISGNIRTPKAWKNSTGSYTGAYLPVTGAAPEANGLFVSGTDVYVSGTEGGMATLWKNSVATHLTPAPSAPFFYYARANGVYVNGTDVYVAGQAPGSLAAYWKNGTEVTLSTGPYTSEAYAVFVAGTDVYAVGYENKMVGSPASLVSVAMLWKNGVAAPLTTGTANSAAVSVYVSGSDVYVAGNEGNFAKVWKNGTPLTLSSTGGNQTVAKSVFVAGTDVYVAGIEHDGTSLNDFAVVWKNNVPVYLTASGYRNAAKSVFVMGADVYVAGTKEGPSANSIATVWKNGFATPLTTGSTDASANCILVK